MSERIDLYDLNHQATGKTIERGLPISPAYCAMVVSFWVRDAAGRLLLEQRAQDKRWFPGFWECGGGSVHAGETGFDAVTRELAEEAGLTPSPNAWRYLGDMDNEEVLEGIFFHHWNLTYMVTLADEAPELHLQTEEVSSARWFTPEELDAFCQAERVTDYTRRLWARYRDALTAPMEKSKKKFGNG